MENLFDGCAEAIMISIAVVFLAGIAVGFWVLPWLVQHIHLALG